MKDHNFVLYVGQRDLYELSAVVGDEGAAPAPAASRPAPAAAAKAPAARKATTRRAN